MLNFVAELACDALGELTFVDGWVEEALSRPTRAFDRVYATDLLDAKGALSTKPSVWFGGGERDRKFEIELAHASALLSMSGGRKIFQDFSTNAIVEKVLAAASIDLAGSVTGRQH